MTTDRFEQQKNFVDDIGDLIGHALDSVAFASEKTIASIVLLLSMLPESIGVGSAMGYTVGVVSASVSLVTVKLALRDRGKLLTLPIIGRRRLFFGWALYVLNLVAGFAFVYSTGEWVDLFLIVVSFCGAVSSEQIAQVIKAEMKERSKVDLQAAKDAIKLDELKANSDMRIDAKRAKLSVTVGNVQSAGNDSQHTPDVEQSTPMAISEEQRRLGQQRGVEAQKTAAQARQQRLYEMLVEDYSGLALDDLNKSAFARVFEVSPTTIKRDFEQLQTAGVLNGVIA